MKAIVVKEYGSPSVLKYEEVTDPVPKQGEVLIRVAATSVNPIDWKLRSRAMKDFMPVQFPCIFGIDVSGTISKVGSGVDHWKVGDQVLAFAGQAYGQLCVAKASSLVRVPKGIEITHAAAYPLVVTTGSQLVTEGAKIKAGQTILITGAAGSVGRSAIFAAKHAGATVMAGVRTKQLDSASSLHADSVVALDDEHAMSQLPKLDTVADTVGGSTAQHLMSKVKKGGVFASALGPPSNAKDYPDVLVAGIGASPDAATLERMIEAVRSGKLIIPIVKSFPLADAAAAHAAAESGVGGKILLLV